jgi:hypothetical protein
MINVTGGKTSDIGATLMALLQVHDLLSKIFCCFIKGNTFLECK